MNCPSSQSYVVYRTSDLADTSLANIQNEIDDDQEEIKKIVVTGVTVIDISLTMDNGEGTDDQLIVVEQ